MTVIVSASGLSAFICGYVRLIVVLLGGFSSAACIGDDVVSLQGYPSKPIRFIVGFAPGGVTDIVSRALGQKLSERLGQQVVVDNRAGGSGTIAAVMTAKA